MRHVGLNNRLYSRTTMLLETVVLLMLFSLGCTRIITEKDFLNPGRMQMLVRSDLVEQHDVERKIDETTTLRGWYLSHKDIAPRPLLIYFYGSGERVFWTAQSRLYWLAENLGVNVLCMDYRGYGFSSGEPGFQSMRQDAVYVYDTWLTEHGGSAFPIFVYGRSMGTVPAVHLAAERSIDGLILEGSPTSAPEILAEMKKQIPGLYKLFIDIRLDPAVRDFHPQPVEQIREISCPLLVIHGAVDKTMPIKFGRKMFDVAGSDKKRWCEVEGVGHDDLSISTEPVAGALKEFVAAQSMKNLVTPIQALPPG